jgi:uncharacterized membrane protein
MLKPLDLRVLRYLIALAVSLVLIVLLIVVALVVERGPSVNPSQLIALLGTVGTLVSILVAVLGVGTVAAKVESVNTSVGEFHEKMNGHLEQHKGHTDEEIAALIDQHLRGRGLLPESGSRSGE